MVARRSYCQAIERIIVDPITFNTIVSGLIVVAAIFAMIGVRRSLSGLKKKLPKTNVGRLGWWVRICIVVLAVLLILNLFGTPLTALISTVGIICGVLAVVFFATWSTLSNFPCTFYLVYAKPFSVGDDLQFPADNLRGRVVDITLVYTVLQDEEGYYVHIPNAQFFQKQFRRKPGDVCIPLGVQLRKREPAKIPKQEAGSQVAGGQSAASAGPIHVTPVGAEEK